MSILDTLYAALQQEGYLPRRTDGEMLSFKYYGQDCMLQLRPVDTQVTIAELSCSLPRPPLGTEAAQTFNLTHPLARLGERDGQAALFLASLLDSPAQARGLLKLMERYAADVVFGERQVEPVAVVAVPPAVQADPEPAELSAPAGTLAAPQVPERPPTAPLAGVPAGWQAFWPLMNERYYPLAQELVRLGVPVPTDVQVDMMQGQQVKGTAIMMWGEAPRAVVICEPGQMIPEGYLGGTWLSHFTVQQVAASIQHNLKRVGPS